MIRKKEHAVRNLVYNVNPLPHSLLNFVLNFGSLKPEDEKKYIECRIKDVIDETVINKRGEFKEQASKLISLCQKYIRQKYGAFTVSLREVRRLVILYRWFYDYIKSKILENRVVEYQNEKFEYNSIKNDLQVKYALILSLFMCYFIRIQTKEQREELNKEISKIAQIDFLQIVHREQEDLVNQVNLPKGIAKNRAILDNMFALFVCICTCIPIFICGKPGCSKSLSANLLYSSMNGEFSKNAFFKKYPRIIRTTFQGSETSTSSDVVKLFDRAKNIIKDFKENKGGH